MFPAPYKQRQCLKSPEEWGFVSYFSSFFPNIWPYCALQESFDLQIIFANLITTLGYVIVNIFGKGPLPISSAFSADWMCFIWADKSCNCTHCWEKALKLKWKIRWKNYTFHWKRICLFMNNTRTELCLWCHINPLKKRQRDEH